MISRPLKRIYASNLKTLHTNFTKARCLKILPVTRVVLFSPRSLVLAGQSSQADERIVFEILFMAIVGTG